MFSYYFLHRTLSNALFIKIREIAPIIKHFLLYVCSSILVRSISVVTTPIALQILSPSDYGELALINSFISVACIVSGLGLRQALFLEYFHGTQEQKNELITTILNLYWYINIPIICIGIALCTYFFGGSISMTTLPLMALSICIVFCYFFSELTYQLLQYEQHAWHFTMLQTSTSFITAIVTIFLLCYTHLGIASILVGQAISSLTVACVGFKFFYKKLHLQPIRSMEWATIKKYLALGIPFIPSMLCAWILAAGDRWVLARYASLADVGIYSLADSFGQLFQLAVLVPFSNAYLPYLMQQFSTHKEKIRNIESWNKKILVIFCVTFFVVIGAGFGIAKSFLAWIIPPQYHESLLYIWLLLMGQLLLVASYFPAALIQFQKKSIFLATALCIPAVLNIILNILLVPQYRIMGCVCATVISYGTYFLIMLAYNMRITRRLPFSEN